MNVADLRRWLADKKAENVVEVIAHNQAYPFTMTQGGGSDGGDDFDSVGFYVDELCQSECTQPRETVEQMDINQAVVEIEKLMMYRESMPEEGKLRNILEAVNTTTNKPSTKSCATCQYEGDDWGVCHDCCSRCMSNYTPRKTSPVG